jgi:hypothetical protein
MGGPRSPGDVEPPRAWLGLAFLAVWLYLLSQLFRIFPNGIAATFDLTVPEARQVLAITSGLGQIGLFAGLLAALARANLAAGVSRSGVQGLALGILGVGILSFFELALFLDWVRLPLGGLANLVLSPALDTGIIAGTALVFAGLASLGVGLARAVNLFGRRRTAIPAPAVTRSEETG